MGFFIYLILCFFAGTIASRKGRSACGFFLLSLICTPVVGLIGACIARSREDKIADREYSTGKKKCPACAEFVKKEAMVCKHCHLDFA